MILSSSEAVTEVTEESKVEEVVDASELICLFFIFEDLLLFGVCNGSALSILKFVP